ncbi:hypothetical protein V8C86DRAFT_2451510 [Haematococcus lacustris]
MRRSVVYDALLLVCASVLGFTVPVSPWAAAAAGIQTHSQRQLLQGQSSPGADSNTKSTSTATQLFLTLNVSVPGSTIFMPNDYGVETYLRLQRLNSVDDLLTPQRLNSTRALLLHHIIPGKLLKLDDIPTGNSKLDTALNGTSLSLFHPPMVPGREPVLQVQAQGNKFPARVVAFDMANPNGGGVMHVVDMVLAPPR